MRKMKKTFGLLLAFSIAVSAMAACGKTEPPSVGETSTPPGQSESQGVVFPLEQPITLVIDVPKADKDSGFFENLELTKKMEKETNVKVEWNVITGDNTQISEKKKIMFASGSYGDVNIAFADQDFLNYSAQGAIIPIEEYINEKNTPNIWAMFQKLPDTRSVVTFPDGHIYTVPKYTGFRENFIENRLWMNKAWLDKLGLSVPKTTDELYDVLKAFKEKDPNGNNEADEIPLTLVDEHAFMHMEALMGMWGLATKSGQFDSYLSVKNNEIVFAPLEPGFKDGMRYMNRLYTEGLLDNEVFTQNEANALAKIASETDRVGLFVHKTNMAKNKDNYIAIAPPKADGYDVNWFVHPGSIGARSKFAVTKLNKYPEITLAWMDKFFTTKDTYIVQFGMDSLSEEAGMLKFKPIPSGMTESKFYDENSYMRTDWPGIIYDEDIGKTVELPPMWRELQKYQGLYDPSLTKTPWPRPLLTGEENEEIVLLRTDIFNAVKSVKAKLVISEGTFDADWDKFVSDLEKMNIDEYVKIQQGAYNRYMQK